jgi:hypothetical protein
MIKYKINSFLIVIFELAWAFAEKHCCWFLNQSAGGLPDFSSFIEAGPRSVNSWKNFCVENCAGDNEGGECEDQFVAARFEEVSLFNKVKGENDEGATDCSHRLSCKN